MRTEKLKSTSVQHTELAVSRGYPGNGVFAYSSRKRFCIHKHLFVPHLSCLADSLWLQAVLDTELSPLTSVYKKFNDTKYTLIFKVSLKIDGARGEGSRGTASLALLTLQAKQSCVEFFFPTALSAHKWGLLFLGPHLSNFDTYTVF